MRAFAVAASLLAGLLIGGWLMLTAQDASSPAVTTTSTTSTSNPTTTSQPPVVAPRTTEVTASSSVPLSDQVLLVWTPGRLPDNLADRVRELEGVLAVTAVRSGLVHLAGSFDSTDKRAYRAPEGFVVPVEAMAFDPSTYPAILPGVDSDVFSGLGGREVILGSTSASLRRLGPGGDLVLEDGTRLEVVAVADDVVIGAAEAAMTVETGTALGVDTERYLLIRYSGSRKSLEDAVRGELPDGLGARIRAPGETPVLRHGDAVLPQVMIKETFGEFAYRPGSDGTFAVDPRWRQDSIDTADVPLLGTLRCHRNLLPALIGAMEELEERNLGSLIQQSQGCFNPRFIAGGRGISRHAWGAAVDINIGSNREGRESIQDSRLVEVMESWGFTSGHEWLIPDPGHFEYARPPDH